MILFLVWGSFMKFRDFLLLLESYWAFEKSQLREPDREEGRHEFEEKLYLCPHVIFFSCKKPFGKWPRVLRSACSLTALGAVLAHPPGPLRAAHWMGNRRPSLGRLSKLEPRKVNLSLSSWNVACKAHAVSVLYFLTQFQRGGGYFAKRKRRRTLSWKRAVGEAGGVGVLVLVVLELWFHHVRGLPGTVHPGGPRDKHLTPFLFA